MMIKKVYIVGAGPGKPDLISVRGRNILRGADVIIYDYLVDKRVLDYGNEAAEFICCQSQHQDKTRRSPLARQENINKLLIQKAREGKMVVRLKGGDPAIFSRCLYEIEALTREGIQFEIVPGITAASAASAFCGIPLTDGRVASECVFVTGHENSSKKKSRIHWDALSKIETVVFYMGVGNLKNIITQLIEAGKDKSTPVVIIQEASFLRQKNIVGTLANIESAARKRRIAPPAIIIIGKIAENGDKFNWFKRNKRILFTGLSEERFPLEGTYDHIPLIKIKSCEDYKGFDGHLKNISGYDWIVFTSRYGVEHFFRRLRAIRFDARKLAGINIAVIGESTAKKLGEYAIIPDLVPKQESSLGLIAAFKKINLNGKKMFIPRSDLSDKGLVKAFEAMGAKVTARVAYKNVMPEDLPDLDLDSYNEIMFTSPSTVRNFKKRYKRIPAHVKVECIGDVTLQEAKRCRLSV